MGRGEVTDNRWRRAHGQLAEESTGTTVDERTWNTGRGEGMDNR
jgi:hypothetical protein